MNTELATYRFSKRSYNSSVQNKAAVDKVDTYDRSYFVVMKEVSTQIYSQRGFSKVRHLGKNSETGQTIALLGGGQNWDSTRYLPTNEELESTSTTE